MKREILRKVIFYSLEMQSDTNGWFHEWIHPGIDSSMAKGIVEDEEGKCHQIPLGSIRFVNMHPTN